MPDEETINLTVEPEPAVKTYVVLDRMSGGATSNVYRIEEPDGVSYAIKASPFSLENEAVILAKIDHPNVLTVLESGKAVLDTTHIPDDKNNGAVVNTIKFRFVPHSFTNILEKLTPEQKQDIFTQQREVLHSLHLKNIVHQDVKTDNILVSDDSHSYLTDFSNAREYLLPAEQEEFEIARQNEIACFDRLSKESLAES